MFPKQGVMPMDNTSVLMPTVHDEGHVKDEPTEFNDDSEAVEHCPPELPGVVRLT